MRGNSLQLSNDRFFAAAFRRKPKLLFHKSTKLFLFRSFVRRLISFSRWKIQQQHVCGWYFSDVTQRLNFSRLWFTFTFHERQLELRLLHAHRARPATSFIVFEAFSFYFFNCFKILLISRNRETARKKLSRQLLFFFTRLSEMIFSSDQHRGLCWRSCLKKVRSSCFDISPWLHAPMQFFFAFFCFFFCHLNWRNFQKLQLNSSYAIAKLFNCKNQHKLNSLRQHNENYFNDAVENCTNESLRIGVLVAWKCVSSSMHCDDRDEKCLRSFCMMSKLEQFHNWN